MVRRREGRMEIEEMKDSAEVERERESQPHEWGERRFNPASSKYRAPQSHFKTCRDIFIHDTQTLTNTHTHTDLKKYWLCLQFSCFFFFFFCLSLSPSLSINAFETLRCNIELIWTSPGGAVHENANVRTTGSDATRTDRAGHCLRGGTDSGWLMTFLSCGWRGAGGTRTSEGEEEE